jgi:hypothetical protein
VLMSRLPSPRVVAPPGSSTPVEHVAVAAAGICRLLEGLCALLSVAPRTAMPIHACGRDKSRRCLAIRACWRRAVAHVALRTRTAARGPASAPAGPPRDRAPCIRVVLPGSMGPNSTAVATAVTHGEVGAWRGSGCSSAPRQRMMGTAR